MRRRPWIGLLVLLVTTGAAAVAQWAAAVEPPCTGKALEGVLAAVPGSAGAGQISYALRLRNRSAGACFVTGVPGLRLLDRSGRPLPSRVVPAFPGAGTAVRVVLAPGAAAVATARFSPDVPGPGEQVEGPCERRAYRVRVTLPAAGLVVPLRPPTPVCEHGRMVLSVLTAAKHA